MYNIRIAKDRENFIKEAAKEDDSCDVDAICDSIPDIIAYIMELEEKVRGYRGQTQKLQSDVYDLQRKLNNLKSQKFRLAKKKGKTLHQ
jgi:predicted RNase H-like nuclease (RuvC/YqgF family)